MEERFSLFGVKWAVTDNGLEYLNRIYPFEQMESVRITKQPSIVSNGGSVSFLMKNAPSVPVSYKKGDHERVVKLVAEINKKLDSKKIDEEPGIVYALHGARGKHLYIYEDHCCIKSSSSFTTLVIGNATDGAKDIYYSDVLGVQCKAPSATLGYIQLETPSLMMNNSASNFFNENTFTYTDKDLSPEKANEVIAFLKSKVSEYKKAKQAPVAVTSNADELLKYKQLLDLGVITQEEFEKKKQELL